MTKKRSATRSGSRSPRPAAFRASRSAAPARGTQPVAHQLHSRFPAALGEYAQVPVEKHPSGGYYIRHVHGTIRASGVRWVRGMLLAPEAAIPATPPTRAAKANLVEDADGHTHYDFTGRKVGKKPIHSGLGPAQPGDRMRLVVWACVESSARTGGSSTKARKSARNQETILLADELPVYELIRWTKGQGGANRRRGATSQAAGRTTASLTTAAPDLGSGDPGGAGAESPTFGLAAATAITNVTNILEPTGTVAVPQVPPGNRVTCKLRNSLATGPKMIRVQAAMFRTFSQAQTAMHANGPTAGTPMLVSPPASSATCLATGAQAGTSNFIVAWAMYEGSSMWFGCAGSGRRVEVL